MNDTKKLMLLDGHSILNRAFYGVPDLTNAKGVHTNAVYGFLNILFKILEQEHPAFLAVAFDVSAPTFRHKTYDAYKGTRKPMPEELKEQVPLLKDVLKAMQILILEAPGFEADDILGTLAKKAEADGLEVSLISGDRDLLQIASEHIKIRIPKTKRTGTEIEDYYAKDVLEKYQVTPAQFVELKALMGDTSDNIPGVPKVGEKTATALLVEYGSLENLYAHVDEISKNAIRESLKANRNLADVSLFLARIKTDVDLPFSYEAAALSDFYTKEAYVLFKELEFKNYLSRFDTAAFLTTESSDSKSEKITSVTALESYLQAIPDRTSVAIVPLTEEGELLGVALCTAKDNSVVYSLYYEEDAAAGELALLLKKEQLKDALAAFSERTRLICAGIKDAYGCLPKAAPATAFDVLIAAYLLNPLQSAYDAVLVCNAYGTMPLPAYEEVFGKTALSHALFAQQDETLSFYGNMARALFCVAPALQEALEKEEMASLFRTLEMPLSRVLFDMEKAGVIVKRDALYDYGQALVDGINALEKKIHEEAGDETFNVNSPKQVGVILFEKLGLPGGKKMKDRYSTSADVLEKLAPDYPIVQDILDYRGLVKLKNTYADGLAAFIMGDGRIHTRFQQTVTATGRLSSTDPNLQNIPMRTPLGRAIRKVFVPAEGCVFIDADYSQIELRILAHMSKDEGLLAAYHEGLDIHRATAAKVFHKPFDAVTDAERRSAKAVNFGIVYGISAHGLSQDLNISRKEAAAYIEQYFALYPKVKAFLDKQVVEAKEKGYVTTLYGRKRPVPELQSANFALRGFGERIAMNSPIQGTAADVMKLAMLAVAKALKAGGYKSRILLQVHDELLLEAPIEEAEAVKALLIKEMEEAVTLQVRLEVDAHIGTDWFEAH